MKPVKQTRIGQGNGNCWTACIASILELPIEEVPDFIDEKDFYGSTIKWLGKRGLTLVQINLEGSPHWPFFWGDTVWTILSGQSPRGDWKHAIVGNGLKYVHDPHPDSKMLKGEIEYVYLLVPITVNIKEEDNEEDDYSSRTSRVREEYSDPEVSESEPVKKRRGRPPGSKNSIKS